MDTFVGINSLPLSGLRSKSCFGHLELLGSSSLLLPLHLVPFPVTWIQSFPGHCFVHWHVSHTWCIWHTWYSFGLILHLVQHLLKCLLSPESTFLSLMSSSHTSLDSSVPFWLNHHSWRFKSYAFNDTIKSGRRNKKRRVKVVFNIYKISQRPLMMKTRIQGFPDFGRKIPWLRKNVWLKFLILLAPNYLQNFFNTHNFDSFSIKSFWINASLINRLVINTFEKRKIKLVDWLILSWLHLTHNDDHSHSFVFFWLHCYAFEGTFFVGQEMVIQQLL